MTEILKRLFWTSRPVSWINTAYPFVAAYLVAGGQNMTQVVIGSIFFLIPYNLLMYGINDVFDFESDQQNPRKQKIEGIVLEKHFHRVVLITSISLATPFVLYLFTQGNAASKYVLIYVIFMVLSYSFKGLRFKERAFLDSFTSASHFAGPMVYGLVLAGWKKEYIPFVICFTLWGIASHAFGAVQDVIPDRKAGIGSIATVIGAQRTVRLSAGAYLAAFLLLAVQTPSAIPVALVGFLYALNVAEFWNIKDMTSQQANRGWKRFMKLNYFAGFIVTMTLLVTNL